MESSLCWSSVSDLKPGDVVLVINPNLPRGHWPLGRFIEVFPGKDGHVRIPKVLL
jgi:hypothetical protein